MVNSTGTIIHSVELQEGKRGQMWMSERAKLASSQYMGYHALVRTTSVFPLLHFTCSWHSVVTYQKSSVSNYTEEINKGAYYCSGTFV
jgi:hypothetical protein